jgi:hypothetical protein
MEGGLRVQVTDSATVWEQQMSASELIEHAAEHDAALWQAQLRGALAGVSKTARVKKERLRVCLCRICGQAHRQTYAES